MNLLITATFIRIIGTHSLLQHMYMYYIRSLCASGGTEVTVWGISLDLALVRLLLNVGGKQVSFVLSFFRDKLLYSVTY